MISPSQFQNPQAQNRKAHDPATQTLSSARSQPWDETLIALYKTQFAPLRAQAARVVGSKAAAEDVVQEAFVRYQLSRTRPLPGKELSYLRSIVLNTARSVVRRRESARRYLQKVEASDVDDRNEWLARYDMEVMLGAIRSLPPRQRAVVAYRLVFDFSERDTADALSISAGTVKTQLSRARHALRIEIQPNEEGSLS